MSKDLPFVPPPVPPRDDNEQKRVSSLYHRIWLARGLILPVTAWNLQAGLAFILQPERFAPSFMLTGVPGTAAVRGVGILFVMWNVPYLAALWNPKRYFLALQLAVAMQAVGLAGEIYILSTLTAEYATLADSIGRFVAFDGIGLLILTAALLSMKKSTP